MGSTNPSFMSGVPELLILRLLRGREMYDYEIVQAIREETGEVVRLGEGVVYPVLHALERDGAITSTRRPVNGRSRIYYDLSPTGASRLSTLRPCGPDWPARSSMSLQITAMPIVPTGVVEIH